MVKKVLIAAGAVVVALVLAVGAYAAYVMGSYYRLDDSLALVVDAPLAGEAQAGIDAQEAEQLTVVAANLGFGAYDAAFDFFMDGGSGSVARSADAVRQNITASAEAVLAEQPDIVLFQEVDVDGTRSHHVDEYALLRDELPEFASVFAQNYDSPYLAWPPYAPHGANKAGLATFSTYELFDPLRRSLPISEGLSKLVDLDRCYSVCRIDAVDGKQLVVFNVHLSAYGADEDIMHGQREMLFADMRAEREAGNFVIAGGDFNHDMIGVSNEVYGNQTEVQESWAMPFPFESVPDGFAVAAKEQLDAGVFASAATCRDAGRPYDGTNDRWVMDAFIYSDNIRCLSCETLDLDFAYSDHNPVVMRFALAGAEL